MEWFTVVINAVTVIALLAFIAFVWLKKKAGTDERTHNMQLRLYSFSFVVTLGGLLLIMLLTGLSLLDFAMLKMSITGLLAIVIISNLGGWLYISKTN